MPRELDGHPTPVAAAKVGDRSELVTAKRIAPFTVRRDRPPDHELKDRAADQRRARVAEELEVRPIDLNLSALLGSGRARTGQRIALTMAGFGLNWQCAVLAVA